MNNFQTFSEINNDADELLTKKLLERSNMDKLMQAPPGNRQTNSAVLHAAVIQKFLNFTPDEKRRFSNNNPVMYKQIIDQLETTPPASAPEQFEQFEPVQPPSTLQSSHSSMISAPENTTFTSFTRMYQSDSEEEEDHVVVPEGPKNKTYYLSFDFRCDLKDRFQNKYTLQMQPRYMRGISYIELESCVINGIPVLDAESHIYIDIGEFDGDYVTSSRKVFGKLLMEKKVGPFITYLPENCKKTFLTPINLPQLTIAFYAYDNSPIVLQKIDLEKLHIDKTASYVSVKQPHCLVDGDRMNLTNNFGNHVVTEMVQVKHVLTPMTCQISMPGMNIGKSSHLLDATLEKIDLKCTLTFKLRLM